jgi:hypothetical protein
VLSGSLDGWGDPLIPLFDLVVFVSVQTEVRLRRLREREARRFGAAAVAAGGRRHQELEEFIEWASRYDNDTRVGRNLKRHDVACGASMPCREHRRDARDPRPRTKCSPLRLSG